MLKASPALPAQVRVLAPRTQGMQPGPDPELGELEKEIEDYNSKNISLGIGWILLKEGTYWE